MHTRTSVRWLNVAFGLWVFISAFAWTHTQAQFTNAWIMGLLCTGMAALAMRVPTFRFANVVLAVWLFVSPWALPAEAMATLWSNLLSAIAIFVVALVPDAPRAAGGPRHAAFQGGAR